MKPHQLKIEGLASGKGEEHICFWGQQIELRVETHSENWGIERLMRPPAFFPSYYGLNGVPPLTTPENSNVEVLKPSTQNVTVYGDRAFKEIIKLK